MTDAAAAHLLDALLESWDRNQMVMANLLRALPPGGLDARAAPGSPTVAQQLAHLSHERLISVAEEAPEAARPLPDGEWLDLDRERLEILLAESAAAVRAAVSGRVRAGCALDRRFGHPALLLQMLIWHEGYHHGQIKLALKLAGCAIPDREAGPLTWDVWRRVWPAR